jgi:hypothetical protein
MTGGEEKEEKNCHMLITSPLNEGGRDKKQNSPSRQRRHASRTAARQADASRVSTGDTVEEAVVGENDNTRNTEAKNVEETENCLKRMTRQLLILLCKPVQ